MTLAQQTLGRSEHLTFKGNGHESRYGWLRLTPAYSLHLVAQIIEGCAADEPRILDPFCGTGTTALLCAERGIACDTTDINPFLIWLARTKTRQYSSQHLDDFANASIEVTKAILDSRRAPAWIPSLHQIEKWWDEKELLALGRAVSKIEHLSANEPGKVVDLLKIAFCRVMIAHAKVSFSHQSMSFRKKEESPLFSFLSSGEQAIAEGWQHSCVVVSRTAASPILVRPAVLLCDARSLTSKLEADRYTCVITSPPYPNRMSYIRELRPYMYWLKFLQDGREAGELDWKAIGGTWGCATSNLANWQPEFSTEVPHDGFPRVLESIRRRSPLLSRYVHKYFCDMAQHCRELFKVVRPEGTVHYIVGNSKFFDTLLPVESIYAALLRTAGFQSLKVRAIRKRTSKKELYEFVVSARKPSMRSHDVYL